MFSLMMLVMGVAPILAPLAGGYLLVLLGWRSIFWALGAVRSCVSGRRGVVAARNTPATTGCRGRDRSSDHGLRPAGGRSPLSRLCAGRRVRSGRHVRLHLGLARGLHRPVRCAGAALRLAVRPECLRLDPGIADQPPAAGEVQRARRSVGRQLRQRRVRYCSGPLGGNRSGRLRRHSGSAVRLRRESRLRLSELGRACHGPAGERAGSASALLGTVQFSAAAIASVSVGVLYDGTARPMAGVIAACGVLAAAGAAPVGEGAGTCAHAAGQIIGYHKRSTP